MSSKRLLAVAISLLAVFTLVACKGNKNKADVQISTTFAETIINDTFSDDTVTEAPAQDTSVIAQTTIQQAVQDVQSAGTDVVTTEQGNENDSDNPEGWSTERIVEEYKNAARKSNASAVSKQSIALKNISVNNGEYANVMDFVGGIMGKFLESNSTEKTGITGGFENMVVADISSAKAYKQGTDTVIELAIVEQTAGAREDANSGSVGHAITAVGDIAVVVDDLSGRGLPLELSEEETKIYYTNPSVKVVINSNGEIVSGTWFYTVEIRMDNFKAFGQNVNTASIVMDNTITV